jgi:hypothetical protein
MARRWLGTLGNIQLWHMQNVEWKKSFLPLPKFWHPTKLGGSQKDCSYSFGCPSCFASVRPFGKKTTSSYRLEPH